MTRLLFLCLMLVLALPLVASDVADPEAALAESQPVERLFGGIREAYYLERITGEEAIKRYGEVLRLAPGSWWAARAEDETLKIRIRDEQWQVFVFEAAGFFQRYPTFVTLHGHPLHWLNRLSADQEQDPALRAAAFAIVQPNLRGRLSTLNGSRIWLNELPLSPLDRYRLAQDLAATCGDGQGVARFLAPFCLQALGVLPPDQAIAEAEAFLDRYAADLPAAHDVYVWLARQRQEDLRPIGEFRQKMRAEEANVRAALDADKPGEALTIMAGWSSYPPWVLEPIWLSLARDGMSQLSDAHLLQALHLGFDQLAIGSAADHLLSLYLGHDCLQAGELLASSMTLLQQLADFYVLERGRFGHALEVWNRVIQRDQPLAEQAAALEVAIEAAARLELKDLEARFRYQRAEQVWHTDRNLALADLRTCIAVSPRGPDAPKAAWLLAMLEEDLSLVHGLQPREPDEVRAFPVADVTFPEGGWVNVHSEGLLAEPWTPAVLPAARVFALSAPTTLKGVTIRADSRFQAVVSLRDAKGRILYRTERAWPFWELLPNPHYWAEPELTLRFLPVAEVAYVQLDLLALADPQAAIRTVAVEAADATTNWRLTAAGENVRGFPLMRWEDPWPHSEEPLLLRRSGGTLSITFYGRTAHLILEGHGTTEWRLGEHRGRQEGKGETIALPVLAHDGPHQLFLSAGPEAGSLRFVALEVADPPPHLPAAKPPTEPLHAVARQLVEQQLAVVYSRRGTEAEAAIARRLAGRANAFLVSDDVGLNDYPGPYLVVGTPLTNRLARQLPARTTIWRDPAFLNSKEGRVDQAKGFAYVTGATPEAVVAAGERLLAALGPPPPREPVSFFAASLFERLYPWQMQPDRPPPAAASWQLARRDRRSYQLGVRFQDTVNELEVRSSKLLSAAGQTLPPPRIRWVAGYEWIPFFASLRLPDLLVEELPLPLPAPVTAGLWLTVATEPTTPPGVYEGTVTVTVNKTSHQLPVRVEVLAATLPPSPHCWYSYAHVPYWYQPGTEAWREAFRQLIQNEAVHGATMVSIDGAISWQGEPPIFDFSLVDWQLQTADELYDQAGLSPPSYKLHAPRDLHHGGDALATAFSRTLAQRLRDQGRFHRFYLKVGDEPRDIEAWRELAEPYAAGGLQITTAHSTYYDLSTVSGIMTAWCPNYQHQVQDHPFLRERQAAGDPFWWYICTYPSTRITALPVDTLPFYWFTADWRLDGGHSYAALSPQPTGPESTGVPFRYDHGLSWRIAFLPDGALIDSVRREYEAEAIHDAELIRQVRELAEPLLRQLLPGKYTYSRDPAEWDQVRRQLYDLAVRQASKR